MLHSSLRGTSGATRFTTPLAVPRASTGASAPIGRIVTGSSPFGRSTYAARGAPPDRLGAPLVGGSVGRSSAERRTIRPAVGGQAELTPRRRAHRTDDDVVLGARALGGDRLGAAGAGEQAGRGE